MQEAILIIAVIICFGFLFFAMSRLDRFISGIRCSGEDEEEHPKPSCVLLDEDLNDEEFSKEVQRFRQSHKGSIIILADEGSSLE